MKTDHVAGKGNVRLSSTERNRKEIKEASEVREKKEDPAVSKKEKEKKVKTTQKYGNHLDAVKKMIGDKIQWRELSFYRHEANGKIYVDVINKKSGEVIRTVPEPDFVKFSNKYKELSGLNINISG